MWPKNHLPFTLQRQNNSLLPYNIITIDRQPTKMCSVMKKSPRTHKTSPIAQFMADSGSESESQYEMMTHRQEMLEKRKRLDKIKKKRQRVNIGNWSLQENLKYKSFLEKNIELFQTGAAVRRLVKVNVMISHEVSTRSSDQCRSHHQKMMKYHKTVPSIIEYIACLQNQEDFSDSVQCKKQGKEEEIIVKEERSTPEEVNHLQMLISAFDSQKAEADDIWGFLEDRIWWDGERI